MYYSKLQLTRKLKFILHFIAYNVYPIQNICYSFCVLYRISGFLYNFNEEYCIAYLAYFQHYPYIYKYDSSPNN